MATESNETASLSLLQLNAKNIITMKNTPIQVFQTTPIELADFLKNAIIPELYEKLSTQFQPKQPEEYLSRAEACELLKINLSTLWRWTKNETLTGYNIQGKVLYKRSEIEAYLQSNSTK